VTSFGNARIGEADLYRGLSARKNERLRNGRLWRKADIAIDVDAAICGHKAWLSSELHHGLSTVTHTNGTVDACANVNHAGTWFYTGRKLNERLTLLRNR
jgi:hypothetical protein